MAGDHSGGTYETYNQIVYDAGHLDADGRPDPFFGQANALRPITVAANLYVATLSYIGGVKLKDPATGRVMASPNDSIITRPDGTEIKDWEALAGYVRTQSAANGGTLPSRYDPARAGSARRAICIGAACR